MLSVVCCALLALAGSVTATITHQGHSLVVSKVVSGTGEMDRIGQTLSLTESTLLASSLYAFNKNGVVNIYSTATDGYHKLRSVSGAMPYGAFGVSMAQSSSHLIVGAPGEVCYDYQGEKSDRFINCGAVYSYQKVNNNDTLVAQRIVNNEKYASESLFGRSVVLSDTTLLIGAPGMSDDGAVRIYTPSNSGWEYSVKLSPPTKGYKGGFGTTMVINQQYDLLVVGAPKEICTTNGYMVSGAAHVFRLDSAASEWVFSQTLFPSQPVEFMDFGGAVAVHNFDIVVGAENDHGAHANKAGSAYVFSMISATSFSQSSWLQANDGAQGDQFGCSVAIDSDYVIVGACAEAGKMNADGKPLQMDDGAVCGARSPSSTNCYSGDISSRGADAGAVYLYHSTSNSDEIFSNSDVEKILPMHSEEGWKFGSSIAIRNGRLVVGATGASGDSGVPNVGAIYDVSFVAEEDENSIDFTESHDTMSHSELFSAFAYFLLAAAVVGIMVFFAIPVRAFVMLKLNGSFESEWSAQAVSPPVTMRRSSPSEHGLLGTSSHAGSETSEHDLPNINLFPKTISDVESPVEGQFTGELPNMQESPISGRVEQYGTSHSSFGVVNGSSMPPSTLPDKSVAEWGVNDYNASKQKRSLFDIIYSAFKK